MTADNTCPLSSGDTTRSLSSSVLEGMICSKGTISPVDGSRGNLDQAVVTDLQEFLDPDAREPQDFDSSPCPEGVIVFQAEVPPLAAVRVVGPDLPGAGLAG